MDFIKELLYLHHQNILERVSSELKLNEEDKKEFFKKYNKVNYQQCILKKRGEKRILYQYQKMNKCVQIEDYISMLQCVHNH